ncbi:MAG: RHS repeat domain-containing protein, partial [Parachlamydiaceae bacterium]
YEIDDFGRIEKVILPDESKIEYRFDGKRIKSIKRNQYIHTYEIYNLGGTPTTIKLANGKGLSSYLDSKGRYLSISSPYFTENDFVYDRRGNLKQHNLNGELKTYEYSDLNQLISDGSDKYSYDSLHNRLFKNQEFYSHNSLNHLLAKNDTVYTYDLNGNRIEKRTPCSTTTYKYDALDRLIEVNADGKTTTYSYDAFNRRMMKNDTSYLYQGQNEIGSMRNNSFLDLRVLGVGLGAEIGSAVLCEIEGVPYVPIHDHNGNVRQLLTMQGELAAAYSYTAFGETIASTVHPNLWRFSSKRFDEETGFINFGRRYYDPEIGRFLTPDPIGFEEGPNLYAYLHNAPLLSFDLYGLLDEDRSWWDKTCDRIYSAWDSLCSAARGA